MNKYDHAAITVSKDQNTLTANGDRFIAVVGSVPGTCTNCSFRSGFGCAAYRPENGGSFCVDIQRKNGRGIIWVPARLDSEAIRRDHEEEYRAGLDSVE